MHRVAILIHGGIGGGLFAQGQPPIQELVSRLAGRFDIDVYSLLPPDKSFQPQGFKIITSPWQAWRAAGWIYLIFKLFRCHIRRPYGVIYAFWGYPAGSLAVISGKLLGIPSVVHLQGGDSVGIPSLKYGVFYHPIKGSICRYTYSQCSRLIALSKFQSACLRNNGVRRQPTIVPFGPDTNRFAFLADRFDQPVIRFLHVGNQTPLKGQRMMLEAFSLVAARLPCRLAIIGGDYYSGKLKEWCTTFAIVGQVEFLGPQPHHLMPDYYHSADILLHTSEFEGQGMVFAEAAACGTLLVGTAVGMLADMGDECAIIASSGGAAVLAQKIVDALSSKERLNKMRENARQWVQEKDVNYTEAEIAGILNELISHDPKSSQKSTRPVEG